MKITRPIRLLLLAGLFGGLATALALGGMGCVAYPSPPSEPAFDTDVLPIFQAHCNRCHGDGPDGGAFNPAGVPGRTYNIAPPMTPNGPFLTQYGDTCPPQADGSPSTCFISTNDCICGAHVFADKIKLYIDPSYTEPMPPRPAPPLNDWELKVVNAWVENPICSHSSNPDPTICPPGS